MLPRERFVDLATKCQAAFMRCWLRAIVERVEGRDLGPERTAPKPPLDGPFVREHAIGVERLYRFTEFLGPNAVGGGRVLQVERVYGKLGVRRRTQAVARARGLGLSV